MDEKIVMSHNYWMGSMVLQVLRCHSWLPTTSTEKFLVKQPDQLQTLIKPFEKWENGSDSSSLSSNRVSLTLVKLLGISPNWLMLTGMMKKLISHPSCGILMVFLTQLLNTKRIRRSIGMLLHLSRD